MRKLTERRQYDLRSLAAYKALRYDNYEDLDLEQDYSDVGLLKLSPYLVYKPEAEEPEAILAEIQDVFKDLIEEDREEYLLEQIGYGSIHVPLSGWWWVGARLSGGDLYNLGEAILRTLDNPRIKNGTHHAAPAIEVEDAYDE